MQDAMRLCPGSGSSLGSCFCLGLNSGMGLGLCSVWVWVTDLAYHDVRQYPQNMRSPTTNAQRAQVVRILDGTRTDLVPFPSPRTWQSHNVHRCLVRDLDYPNPSK
eukprot:302164-Prorocentrum_minimum.AAC.1